MTETLKISIASPPDRQKVVAQIDFGNEQFAEINQDTNIVHIELYPRSDGQPWKLPLLDVLEILNSAQNKLLTFQSKLSK